MSLALQSQGFEAVNILVMIFEGIIQTVTKKVKNSVLCLVTFYPRGFGY